MTQHIYISRTLSNTLELSKAMSTRTLVLPHSLMGECQSLHRREAHIQAGHHLHIKSEYKQMEMKEDKVHNTKARSYFSLQIVIK